MFQYIHLLTTLAIIVVLLMLLVFLPILLTIKKKLNRTIQCLDQVKDAIEKFTENTSNMHDMILLNFKDVFANTAIAESKQTSIKDALDYISKAMGDYHNKAINAINFITRTSNKATRGNKIAKRSNTPKDKDSGSNELKKA